MKSDRLRVEPYYLTILLTLLTIMVSDYITDFKLIAVYLKGVVIVSVLARSV